jgi:hypothetical protein
MAEEAKTEVKKEDGKKMMGTILKVILGLAFLALGAWLVYKGWPYIWVLIKGSAGIIVILAGIITLAIAKE